MDLGLNHGLDGQVWPELTVDKSGLWSELRIGPRKVDWGGPIDSSASALSTSVHRM